jgi:hypothetical protein
VLFWDAVDLERKLSELRLYYNEVRVHSALGGRSPPEIGTAKRPITRPPYRWRPFGRGLYERPVAA